MRRSLLVPCVLALPVLALGLWWLHPAEEPDSLPDDAALLPPAPAAPRVAPGAGGRAKRTEAVSEAWMQRLAYGQHWRGEVPPELSAFRSWSERYQAAAPAERAGLVAAGVRLARARRPVLLALMRSDPARALAVTPPVAVLAALPATVRAELETRVAGRGDFQLVARMPAPEAAARPSLEHRVVLAGSAYHAHVYGRRSGQLSRLGASLHGIALAGELALHESPARLREAGETAVFAPARRPGGGAEVEAFGRVFALAATDEALAEFVRRLEQAEAGPGPRVSAPDEGPETAAAPPTSHTIGTKRVLVIRADFADVPGAAVAEAEAQTLMDQQVKPFFERSSYGRTTLVTTVTPKVYRLPLPAATYALTLSAFDVQRDARAAAGADYAVGGFDRVVVVCPYIGAGRIPGSRINDGGSAIVGADQVWLNGGFTFYLLVHELGHTYGLPHANLWQVSDGDPISPNGNSLEYGDPFDLMGGIGTDARADFSMWAKNRLGWLPDAAVRTLATSGTYRVHRFDHADAAGFGAPLALRIERDGQRAYWLGLRQDPSGDGRLARSLYVLWGYDTFRSPELLDLTTPGTDVADAGLALGRTFVDPLYGISFRPVAQGGVAPATWLDVEVTVPTVRPDGVRGWGGQSVVPPGMTGVRAVAADDSHVLALKADGTLTGWWLGGMAYALPPGLANIESIATGGGSDAIVRRDGTAHYWGPGVDRFPIPAAARSGVRQVAIGRGHFLALKTDGTVVAWGENDAGQATVPAGLEGVVAITAGYQTSFALKADGSIARWGLVRPNDIPLPAGLRDATAISAIYSSQHLVVLRADGTVLVAGASDLGQAAVPAGLGNVVAIAAGTAHSLALRADGSVVGWGSGGSGETVVPADLGRAFGLAANSQASFAVTGGGGFFIAQPRSAVVAAGAPTEFAVEVSARGALAYQWRKDGVPVAGATAPTLRLTNPAAADAGFYDVVVTDPGGTITSRPARLSVVPPLVVVRSPQAQEVEYGARAIFTVEATGAGALTYQWRRNGVAVPGGTAASLVLPEVTPADAGAYDVVLADGVSTLVSASALLLPLPPTRLANLSIRSQAGTAARTLIVGFVVGGRETAGTKALLLRGAGPALAAFGVADALADPKLELYRETVRVGENDNWGGAASLAAVAARVGAFAFGPGTSRDAALHAEELGPAVYSVQVTAADGGNGIVLAEIYDATPADAFRRSSRRLVNVSARTLVGTDGAVLIAGFNISGARTKTVLIRGIGPALAAFGVDGTLANPRLDLFDAAGARRQENDDWGGTPVLAQIFGAVGAFPLATDSRDAALVTTLAPGSYTVQVSGVGGQTGIGLVEIYEVP